VFETLTAADSVRLYWFVCLPASVLALGEYSELKDKYEQQLQLNQVAEKFAHEVCLQSVYIYKTLCSSD